MINELPSRKGYTPPATPPTRDEVVALIAAAQLPRLESTLIAGMKDAVRLHLAPTPLDAIPLGASRIGGLPDLPEHLAWPQVNQQPMVFLAQLACSELAPFDTEHLLPATGTLWFFLDAQIAAGCLYEVTPTNSAVIYDDSTPDNYQRASKPESLPDTLCLSPRSFGYSCEAELPPFKSEPLAALGLSESMYGSKDNAQLRLETDRLFALDKALQALHGWDPDHHISLPKVFGYPDAVQCDVQIQVHHNASGAAIFDKTPPGASEWVLLLQVDAWDVAYNEWGDIGTLYFLIHQQALAQLDFSKVWIVLQST